MSRVVGHGEDAGRWGLRTEGGAAGGTDGSEGSDGKEVQSRLRFGAVCKRPQVARRGGADRLRFNPVFDSVPSASFNALVSPAQWAWLFQSRLRLGAVCKLPSGSSRSTARPRVSIPSSTRCRLQGATTRRLSRCSRSFNPVFDSVPSARPRPRERGPQGPQQFQSRLRLGAVCKPPVRTLTADPASAMFQSRLRLGAVCKRAGWGQPVHGCADPVSIPSSTRCRLQAKRLEKQFQEVFELFQSRLRLGAVCKTPSRRASAPAPAWFQSRLRLGAVCKMGQNSNAVVITRHVSIPSSTRCRLQAPRLLPGDPDRVGGFNPVFDSVPSASR